MAKSGFARRIAADMLRDSMQIEGVKTSALTSIFEREPPPLTEFITSSKYLNNPRLSDIQYDFVRHLEQIYKPDLYPAMVEEFGEYWMPVRMVNFLVAQYGKGCLGKNEEIYDVSSGRWRKVSEITSPFIVQGTNEVNSDGSTNHTSGQPVFVNGTDRVAAQASVPFVRGRGQMVRVTTASGASIEVYAGHLFASWSSDIPSHRSRYDLAKPTWVSARDLLPGSRIATMSKLDIQNPVAQDPREVELAGYWIGDGSMPTKTSNQGGLYIDPSATDLIDRYVSLVESYEGFTAKIETMQSGAYRVMATRSGKWVTHKSELVEIIRKLGLYGSRAWDKKVPEEYFSLPDSQLATFLSALWDTDGCIYLKKSGNKSPSPAFEYCTVSEQLARDIQRLLLRFGVVSRLRSKNTSYTYKGEKRSGRTAWTVTVTAGKFVKRLASVLSLHGHKEELRQVAENWQYANEQQATTGDIFWDKVKTIEHLGEDEYWDINVPNVGSYVAGQIAFYSSNSGKDHICRIGVTRAADLLMCLRSPQDYFGMSAQDEIQILNVAASADQARRAFFQPMKRLFVTNPHLAKFFRGSVPGEMATSIRLKKGLELVSGHSMAETQEGLNLIVAIADEISAFKTAEELARSGRVPEGRAAANSAEGILRMLRTSARTRFPESFKVAQLSYPRFKGDAIQQATAQGLANIERNGERSQYYVSGPYSTWEVRPGISKAQFAGDYEEDPETAKAMYECNPPASVNRFMRNDHAIYAAFQKEIPEPVVVEYYWGLPEGGVESSLAPAERPGWQVRFHFDPGLYAMDGAGYALHGDLAITGDRAGIAMSHVRTWSENQFNPLDDTLEPRPVIKNDFTFAFEADLTIMDDDGTPRPREIQIRWYRQLVWELISRGFYIASVTFDNFQSADMVQILESRGIESGKLSLDRNDMVYQVFKDVVYDNRLESYRNLLVMEEVRSLRKLPNGKIDHPDSGSKDCADALAGSVYGAIEVGGSEGDAPIPVRSGSFSFSNFTGSEQSLDLSFGGSGYSGSLEAMDLGSLAFGR